MNLAMKLLTILAPSSAPAVPNYAPPVTANLPSTSIRHRFVHGTPGTWSGSPTLTYQWQRFVASVWTDIGGATTLNRAPVDADFGYALSVLEIPNGVTASAVRSNTTNLTQEAPAQSLGSEALVDGDAEAVGTAAWTSVSGTAMLSKQTGTPHGGTQCFRVARLFGNPAASQTILTVGDYYEATGWYRGDGTAEPRVFRTVQLLSLLEQVWAYGRITEWDFVQRRLILETVPIRSLVHNMLSMIDQSVKKITPNVQLVAPSANMRIGFFFTPPVSPIAGDYVLVPLRIRPIGLLEITAWRYCLYSGSQWNLTAHIVTTHTRGAAIITALNVGPVNGLRINSNGNSWTLESTNANDGGLWTSRGSATNSTYNTAVGVNVIYSSTVTPKAGGSLQYEPAA